MCECVYVQGVCVYVQGVCVCMYGGVCEREREGDTLPRSRPSALPPAVPPYWRAELGPSTRPRSASPEGVGRSGYDAPLPRAVVPSPVASAV